MTIKIAHSDVSKRLKRAHGHLKSIIAMLEEGRGCLDIAQQLQAVEKAITSAKKVLVHNHIDHCLERTVREASLSEDNAIRELKEISKYL
jgi:uncharacterized protein